MLIRNFALMILPFVYIYNLAKRRIFKKYGVLAITFHDIRKSDEAQFQRIIQHLHKNFSFITPEQFENYLDGKFQLKDTSILITFDDGFKSSKDITDQVLKPLNIKAVFFCCPNFLNNDEAKARQFVAHNLFKGEKKEEEISSTQFPMNNNEIKELIIDGHKLAGHTMSHKDLGKNLEKETLKEEVSGPIDYFREQFNYFVSWFAFPFGGIGYINNQSMEVIKKNYQYCFSGIRGEITLDSHKMALPRQSVSFDDPYLLQLALIYGATNFMHERKTHLIEQMAL